MSLSSFSLSPFPCPFPGWSWRAAGSEASKTGRIGRLERTTPILALDQVPGRGEDGDDYDSDYYDDGSTGGGEDGGGGTARRGHLAQGGLRSHAAVAQALDSLRPPSVTSMGGGGASSSAAPFRGHSPLVVTSGAGTASGHFLAFGLQRARPRRRTRRGGGTVVHWEGSVRLLAFQSQQGWGGGPPCTLRPPVVSATPATAMDAFWSADGGTKALTEGGESKAGAETKSGGGGGGGVVSSSSPSAASGGAHAVPWGRGGNTLFLETEERLSSSTGGGGGGGGSLSQPVAVHTATWLVRRFFDLRIPQVSTRRGKMMEGGG